MVAYISAQQLQNNIIGTNIHLSDDEEKYHYHGSSDISGCTVREIVQYITNPPSAIVGNELYLNDALTFGNGLPYIENKDYFREFLSIYPQLNECFESDRYLPRFKDGSTHALELYIKYIKKTAKNLFIHF